MQLDNWTKNKNKKHFRWLVSQFLTGTISEFSTSAVFLASLVLMTCTLLQLDDTQQTEHQGRLLQGEQDERPELCLYTCLTGHCVQVWASPFLRQPLKGWEDKVHSGWTSGEIYLCKVLLNIRTDSPWSGWSHRPSKCSRNNCMWHLVLWSSWQGGDHLKTGLNDLRGISKSKWFCSSLTDN